MALTAPEASLCAFSLFMSGQKNPKPNQKTKHKPPQGTLGGFVGIIWM